MCKILNLLNKRAVSGPFLIMNICLYFIYEFYVAHSGCCSKVALKLC